MQLEMCYWGPRTLRGAIGDYMARRTDDLAEATVGDYEDRCAWLLRELGELTDIRAITTDALEKLARRHQGFIANVTIKRRLVFLRAVLKYARDRDLLDKIPALPRLRNDGQPRTQLHTVEQWRVFRGYLAPGPFRRLYDVGFWTGFHLGDLFRVLRGHFKPTARIGDRVGAFWRVNTKSDAEPMWFPAEPELVELMREFGGGARLDSPVIGRLWNVRRTLHMAAHRAIADGHDIPIVSPIDLRRSYASMLSSRGYPLEYIRIALGHKGGVPHDSLTTGRLAAKPTIAEAHYMRPTPALLSFRST